MIDSALLPVAETLTEFVLGGGKRMRPAFAYWGFRGAGGVDSDEAVACLSTLELVQASALIHDDVIDSSDIRRGIPAVHRRFADRHVAEGWSGDPEAFGQAAAILLGDLCLVWSDELFDGSGVAPAAIARARPIFDQMRTEVTAGQYLDVLAVATRDTSLERASKIAVYKSAKYTVERPILLGGALAGADEALMASYSAYGLPLGEAFQLRDDMLGVFGDPAVTGKPAGDDLREGKRTYLIAVAIASATPAARERIGALLGNPALDQSGVATLREIITSTGALSKVEARIVELTDAAHHALESAPVEVEARAVLDELIMAATRRTG
jgi:geranylgeranyl diphosphate synthase type I